LDSGLKIEGLKLGFKVEGLELGFKVEGFELGCKIEGLDLGFKVEGSELGFKDLRSGFKVEGSELGFEVEDLELGFKVEGLESSLVAARGIVSPEELAPLCHILTPHLQTKGVSQWLQVSAASSRIPPAETGHVRRRVLDEYRRIPKCVLGTSYVDHTLVGLLWEGYHESRRCSGDICPESYITKYTSIRR